MRINGDWLYSSPDGREAWVVFDRNKGLAFITTDIHGTGMPYNSVGISASTLRAIADELDRTP